MYTDMPYIVFYLSLIICTIFYWKYESPMAVKASFVITFIFFAFRAPVVGADTWNYVRYLAGMRDYYSEWDDRALEFLFVVYRTIVQHLSPNFMVVMVINTVCSLWPLYIITKKYSSNVPLSILMFVNLNCLILYFVGLRQILALVPILFALVYCIENELPRMKQAAIFLVASLVSVGFHSTGLIYGLVYYLALVVPVTKRKVYIASIIASALVGFIMEKYNALDILSSISSLNLSILQRVDAYLIGDDQNELSAITIALRPSVIGLMVFSLIKEERLNHPFSKIFLVGIILYNFLATIPMVHRMVLPMIMFGSIVFSWCYSKELELSDKLEKVLYILTILIFAYFGRSWFIQCTYWSYMDESCMHPYYFVFEDYE
jgi:hypothetical protein